MDSKMEWLPIEQAPVTGENYGDFKRMKCLLFSPDFGVRSAEMYRIKGDLPHGQVSNLHGDAIGEWNATHWMPLPAPPATPEKSA